MPRLAAAVIALIAWAGLAIQFQSTLAQTGSVLETSFILLRFFTVLTNLLVAVTFTALALGRTVSPFWLGGVTLAIVLVGMVYMLLLRGLVELSGGALLADTLLHKVVPCWSRSIGWPSPPKADCGGATRSPGVSIQLAYSAYALVRGSWEGLYAYPFMDVAQIGYGQTAINAVAIAAGFVATGLALVGLDQMLAPAKKQDKQ